MRPRDNRGKQSSFNPATMLIRACGEERGGRNASAVSFPYDRMAERTVAV